jgi:hypothetical protein
VITRDEVYAAIDSERDYQDRMTEDSARPDMINNLSPGDHLLAMEHALLQARTAWYAGSSPHPEAAEYVRKVAGLAVAWMERNSAPKRKM